MSSHRPPSRRDFLKQASVIAVAATLPSTVFGSTPHAHSTDAATPQSATANRAPLAANVFNQLPVGAVRPSGWLKSQLKIQADGLSGHLDEVWADVGPNSGWLGGTGESWERGPYYLDGLVPLAYLLDDQHLKAKAQRYIDWTLDHQAPDGMIGPRTNNDWWPRIVMLKVLTQYHDATGDPRVIPCLTRYFHHQLGALPARPLVDWGKYRWQDEVLSVIWLYNRTGDPSLLTLMHLLQQQGYDWQAQFVDFKYTQRITPEAINLKPGSLSEASLQTHGVNNAQAIKASPVWSLVSHSDNDRQAIFRQLATLDRYHGLPNGMFSADEHFAGRNPSQGTELCTVVEEMFSLEQALAILGDAALADRLERIAFNALPGTFSDDMWAHQYNQEPNQVECSLHHKPWTTDGPESNLYGLAPNFGCCTANFHQGWPKLTASLWMTSAGTQDQQEGLVATVYAPCEVRTTIAGVGVHMVEETEYPFRGTVRITVHPASAVRFPLQLRIPHWASGAAIKVNGHPEEASAAGSFASILRTWKAGDVIELNFPLKPTLSRGYNNSVSLQRGPLVFSYPIAEDWVKLRDRGLAADWQVFPASPWNYALAVDETSTGAILVEESALDTAPFSKKSPSVKLRVKAKKLPAWRAEDGVANALPPSPVTSGEAEETITLIPYAAAKLRITAFPQLKS